MKTTWQRIKGLFSHRPRTSSPRLAVQAGIKAGPDAEASTSVAW